MRGLIRSILVYALALYFTALLLPGLIVTPTFENYLTLAVLLTVCAAILSPVLGIITMPFNLITLGFFSSVITLISLFVISNVYRGVQIKPFDFPGWSFFNVSIPAFHASLPLSYIIISVIIFSIVRVSRWLSDE